MFNRLVSPIEPIYRRGKSIDVNKTIKLSQIFVTKRILKESIAFLRWSLTRMTIGTLRNDDDDDGSENVAKKMNLRSFEL